jgi:hypothetical protein
MTTAVIRMMKLPVNILMVCCVVIVTVNARMLHYTECQPR